MVRPRICLAGIDIESKQHLRPVTDRDHPLTRELLAEEGGPFQLGAVVELGPLEPRPVQPETEDQSFDPENAHRVGLLDTDEYLALVDDLAENSLGEAFGEDLVRLGKKRAVEAGKGDRSLGCVRSRLTAELFVDDRSGKLQLRLSDPDGAAYIPVNDLRFYEEDHKTLRAGLAEDVQRRLEHGVSAWIMLGLARALEGWEGVWWHWLQVNGICLEDSPLGVAP